jgi:hypothetical protein
VARRSSAPVAFLLPDSSLEPMAVFAPGCARVAKASAWLAGRARTVKGVESGLAADALATAESALTAEPEPLFRWFLHAKVSSGPSLETGYCVVGWFAGSAGSRVVARVPTDVQAAATFVAGLVLWATAVSCFAVVGEVRQNFGRCPEFCFPAQRPGESAVDRASFRFWPLGFRATLDVECSHQPRAAGLWRAPVPG